MAIGKFLQYAWTKGTQILTIDLNLLCATSIIFFISASVTVTSIYSTTLFLSFYPRTWLAYLLGAQALVSILISFILTPALTTRIKKNSVLILFLTGLLCLILAELFYFKLQGSIFTIAVITGSMGSLLTIVGWNIIPFAFGIRDYKKIARYAGQFSILGIIFSSFIVPLLLIHFTLQSLLYVAVLLILTSVIFVCALKLVRGHSTAKKINVESRSLQYPLFQKILIFTILIVLTQTLIDYVFKFELAHHFTDKALGTFLGYYKALTNLLALIVGVTTTRYFLKYFHLEGLLYITQVSSLIACVLTLIFPSLWAIAILESIKILFYYNYTLLAIEIILNILPNAVRISGKIQTKTIATPLCAIIVYFILILTKNHISMYELLCFTAIALIPNIYLIKKITDEYKIMLQNETEFQRFNLFSDKSLSSEIFFEDIANAALQFNEKDLVLSGLNLIDTAEKNKLPPALNEHLNHPDPLIRKTVIQLIKRSGNETMLKPLEEQFLSEKNSELKFYLVDAITALNPDKALKILKEYKGDLFSELYTAYMIRYGTLDEIQTAKMNLQALIRSNNPIAKKEAIFIISENNLKENEKDLELLIKDTDREVSEAAISVAAEMGMFNLIPAIFEKLSRSKITIITKKAIAKFGEPSIPYFLNEFSKKNNLRLLIKLMAAIPGKKAESVFLELIKTENIFYRTFLAKEMMYRACQLPVSYQFKNEAIQFIFFESGHIEYLQHLLSEYSQSAISAEISSRIQMAKQRILNWLAIATDPVQINKISPVLLKQTSQDSYLLVKEKALELLEIYIKNKKLLTTILYFFDISVDQKTNIYFSNSLTDSWLEKVISFQANHSRHDDMNLFKVLVLRQVELFKDLPGEVLLSIAEETKTLSFKKNDVIFLENTLPDGLYIIVSGKINIIRQEKVLNTLGEYQYFGELALIDNSVRTASAIAETDCECLFLDKSTFDRITDDLPEVLRVVSQVILRYLRQNLEGESEGRGQKTEDRKS